MGPFPDDLSIQSILHEKSSPVTESLADKATIS